MSDPYDDQSPPWNLPWPDNPFPPTHAAATAPVAFATAAPASSLVFAPPPIAPLARSTAAESAQLLPPDNYAALGHARQVRVTITKRGLGQEWWGLSQAGVWLAERVGELAGWEAVTGPATAVEMERKLLANGGLTDGGVDGSEAGPAHRRVATASASQQDEDDLPVDANFYFFLFVCKRQ